MTKHLNYPIRICRVCESTGRQLTDLAKETNRSVVKKLRAVADISVSVQHFNQLMVGMYYLLLQFDVNDQLPKGLCKKCIENLDRAYKFKIQCEYTEQKLRDALRDNDDCETEKFTVYVSTITAGSDDETNVNDAVQNDDNPKSEVDVLEDDGEEDELYEDTSLISKEEEHLIDDESTSQTSAVNSQLIAADTIAEDGEVNMDYGDIERLEEDDQYGDMGEVLEGEVGEFTAVDEVEYIYDEGEIEFLDNDNDKSDDWRKVETRAKTTKANKSNSRDPDTDKFHCDTCGAPFEKYNDLNEHKKTHGNKRYQCPTCSRWFSKKYHMKNHQTIHLNQKLFACTLCTKKYTNQGNLDRHVRVFHHNEKQVIWCIDLRHTLKSFSCRK